MSRHFRCLICKRQWRIIWWLYKSILYIELINYSSCRTLAYFWKTAPIYSGSIIRITISALLVRWMGKDSNKRFWTNETGNTARNHVASKHLLWQIWSYFDPGIILCWILWHLVWLYWRFWWAVNLSRRRRIPCCLWRWFLVSSIVLTKITNWFRYHSGTALRTSENCMSGHSSGHSKWAFWRGESGRSFNLTVVWKWTVSNRTVLWP